MKNNKICGRLFHIKLFQDLDKSVIDTYKGLI